MTDKKLYNPFKVKNESGFYCYKCEKWHSKEEVNYFYNVVAGNEIYMSSCRSCSIEYAQELSDSYNERNERIKLLSTNPENPVNV
jgi:hypothetical protein